MLDDGDKLALGLRDDDSEALGLLLADGLRLDEGLNEELGDTEALGELLAEADGLSEAEGLRDTLKLCIQIIQFSVVKPVTFLNS